ncbi:cobalt-precorrin-6A reductase [Varunaivibrio sulfuroxidans]|uniref:Precorrin-6A reductase n=1 Tax=Varunaivibrio sulfuroxidans TaxID=1773489 RepID=A0A4R3JG78_9PROT|nr:cobalt-precorrin-6A reductase [Varunaivibrio sulfuroxidans]TCS65159.1 precorrin-6A reductase [Varunaivibrio sulfuroxidans]WES29558.1 cobalt-precorrin-6A reductase [Varunaivibrio sulfuroxidans]
MVKRLLILGGTSEAAELSHTAAKTFAGRAQVVTSLAGSTRSPRLDLAGGVRRGGFGGIEGLSRYLRDENIAAVIDATHPFAETISGHAYCACLRTATPLLRLERPAWTLPPAARWVEVATMTAAVEVLGGFARRVFLGIGRKNLAMFTALEEIFFLVRTIDPLPAPPPLARHHALVARPPFAVNDEKALLTEHRIDTVVAKNSGGAAARAKIDAALALDLSVVLIARPAPEPCPTTARLDEALAWLEDVL